MPPSLRVRCVSVPLVVLWSISPKVSTMSGSLSNLQHFLMEDPHVKLSQDGSAVLLQEKGNKVLFMSLCPDIISCYVLQACLLLSSSYVSTFSSCLKATETYFAVSLHQKHRSSFFLMFILLSLPQWGVNINRTLPHLPTRCRLCFISMNHFQHSCFIMVILALSLFMNKVLSVDSVFISWSWALLWF